MGLFKKIGKLAKKAVKVVKKVAPIALALTGVGGVVGGIATKAVTAASKLKSKGVNVKQAAYRDIPALSTTIAIKKAVAPKVAPVSYLPRATSPSSPKQPRAAKPKQPPAPTKAEWTELYKQFKQYQINNPDDIGDWETFAKSYLQQRTVVPATRGNIGL